MWMLQVAASGFRGTMGGLAFGERVSVDGGAQSITLIRASSFQYCCLYAATSSLLFLPSHLPCTLSHHLSLADRRTDGRLSRARNAPFLFFTS